MIGASPMYPGQPGPCVICGDTNYNLSCGGPTICPKCDCGNFDAATVQTQAKIIIALRQEIESLRRPAQRALPDDVAKKVAAARSRIDAMKIAPCSGIASSKQAAKEFEEALDALSAVTSTERNSETERHPECPCEAGKCTFPKCTCALTPADGGGK